MGFIPVDVTGTSEPKAVPNGRYDLSISSAEEALSKEKKKPMVVVYINIEGHPEAPNIRHNVSLPTPEDEPKAKEFKMLLLKRFLTLFKIPYDANGFNVDDFVGARADHVELKLTDVDEKGNQYNEMMLPRMASEAAPKLAVARPPKTA